LSTATEHWLDDHIFPQLGSLLLNDAYFKLVRYVSQLTQRYIEPLGHLVVIGYVTYQMMGIRRLCDDRRDAISLRRLLIDTSIPKQQELLQKLDVCKAICDTTDHHIAHTGNPARRPKITDWNVTDDDLTNAHKALCQVAIALERSRAKPKGYVRIIPEATTLNMLEFNLSASDTKKLWDFWRAHNNTVNAWIR
jgi:hypothetical protein